MTVTMDEHDLRQFAEAVVAAQKEVELEMATQPNVSFATAIWEYKWGLVIERALAKSFA